MISKEQALKKVRNQYPNCYVTNMSNWEDYYIFYLVAKNKDNDMTFNTPFDIVVNQDGQIGSINLGQVAKNKNRYEDYLKQRDGNMIELDKIPKEEQKCDWFDDLFNEVSK